MDVSWVFVVSFSIRKAQQGSSYDKIILVLPFERKSLPSRKRLTTLAT